MSQRDESTHELISAYLDGELTEDERARVEQWLQTSPDCQESLQEMQSVRVAMRSLPRYQFGEEAAERVLLAAGETQSSRRVQPERASSGPGRSRDKRDKTSNRRRRWYGGLSLVAGAAAALWIAFLVDSPRDRSEPGRDTASVMSDDQRREDDGGGHAGADRPERGRVPAERRNTRTEKPGKPSQPSSTPPKPASKSPVHLVPPDGPSSKYASQDGNLEDGNLEDGNLDDGNLDDGNLDDGGLDIEPRDLASSGAEPESGREPVDGFPQPAPQEPSGRSPPKTELGPGQLSRDLLFVIEVNMTPSGWKRGAFERVLNQAGVAFDANVKMDAELKRTLLESRFFEPSSRAGERSDDQPAAPVTIVYVEAPAGALDRAWRRMKRDQSHFARVSLDMALRSEDISIFDQLRQSSRQGTASPQNSEGDGRGMARRLDLPPSWDGIPASEAPDPAGLTDNAGQGTGPRRFESLGSVPGQSSSPAPFGASSDVLGSIRVEAMFVLHDISRSPEGDSAASRP